jgi:hypothetical protein
MKPWTSRLQQARRHCRPRLDFDVVVVPPSGNTAAVRLHACQRPARNLTSAPENRSEKSHTRIMPPVAKW